MDLAIANGLDTAKRGAPGPGAPNFIAELLGLTDNPSFGLAAEIGVALTASASAFSGNAPSTVSYEWSTMEGGKIPGATAASYTPDASRDGQRLYCRISPQGYPKRDTPPYRIRRAPPVAAGLLGALSLTEGTGLQTFDASGDFTGQGLNYAISGGLPGIAIDGATGVLTVDTGQTGQVAGAILTITATNSGGSVSSDLGLAISAGLAPPVATGALPDLSLAEGVAVTISGIPADFSGQGLVFGLAPGSDTLPVGLSLDTGGVLSGTPGELAVGRTIVVRASNAAGFADSAFGLDVFALDFAVSLTGLTDNPTHGPSAQSGVLLAVQAGAFNGPAPGPLSYQWGTLESGALAGGTLATFAPDAGANDGENLFCTVTDGVYPAKSTATSVIRHAPPAAGGALADQTWRLGQAIPPLAAAADFTGQALVYALAPASAPLPAGIVLDPATGGLDGIPTALSPATTIVLRASNSGGAADSAFTVAVNDVPSAFQAGDWTLSDPASDGDLSISVLALPATNNAAISELQYTTDGGATWRGLTGTGPGARVVSLESDGATMLANGTAYFLALRAVNAVGVGPAGDTKTATPTLGATVPEQFAAGDWTLADAGTGGALDLVVLALPSDGGSGIIDLEVEVSGSPWVSLGGSTAGAYQVTGLPDGLSASIVLRAVNAVGAGAPSAAKTAIPSAPATAPAQMAAPTVASTGQTSLSVDLAAAPADGGSPITGYDLRHSTDQAIWTDVPGVSDPVALTGLAVGTAYFVQTRAVNAVGAGAWSPSGSASTDAATAPAQMAAPLVTSTGQTSLSVNLGAAPADGGAPVTSFDLRYSTDQATWTDVPGVSDPEALAGLAVGTAYFVQIRAVNGVGAGAWSPSGTASTDAATAPAQMAAPLVTTVSASSISVDLAAAPADGGSPITSYDLRHSTDQSSWTTLNGVSDPQAVFGLTASTTYFVETRAVNAAGAGAWSPAGQTTTMAGGGDTTPPEITAFSAIKGTSAVDASFVIDENASVYFVLTASATPPLPSQVRSGRDDMGAIAAHAWSVTTTAPSGNATETLPATLDGTYYIHAVAEDAAGNLGTTVDSSAALLLDTIDPVLSLPTAISTGATTADWTVTSDEADGTIFAAVRLATSPVLTAAQIESGGGGAIATSSDTTPSAGATNAGSFSGLSAATSYRVDLFHRDSDGNESAVVSTAPFSTAGATSATGFVSFTNSPNNSLVHAVTDAWPAERLVIVVMGRFAGATINNVTVGGAAASQRGTLVTSGSSAVAVFDFDNGGGSGTQAIEAAFSNSQVNVKIAVYAVGGKAFQAIDSVSLGGGNPSAFDFSFTTGTGDAVIAGAILEYVGVETFTAGPNLTLDAEDEQAVEAASASNMSTTGQTSFGITHGRAFKNRVGVAVHYS